MNQTSFLSPGVPFCSHSLNRLMETWPYLETGEIFLLTKVSYIFTLVQNHTVFTESNIILSTVILEPFILLLFSTIILVTLEHLTFFWIPECRRILCLARVGVSFAEQLMFRISWDGRISALPWLIHKKASWWRQAHNLERWEKTLSVTLSYLSWE